jgi:hypothetical protein
VVSFDGRQRESEKGGRFGRGDQAAGSVMSPAKEDRTARNRQRRASGLDDDWQQDALSVTLDDDLGAMTRAVALDESA